MIKHLLSTGLGFEPKLEIASPAGDEANCFTVFIAENGGRKSFLLRCLVQATLGLPRSSGGGRSAVKISPVDVIPSRVIAISGTPLDRFPRDGTTDLRSKRRNREERFVYIGPRASNGMAGTAQSRRSLVGSLISNRHLLAERAKIIRRAFGVLNLEFKIDVSLIVNSDFRGNLSELELELERLAAYYGASAMEAKPEALEVLKAIGEMKKDPERIWFKLKRKTPSDLRLSLGTVPGLSGRAGVFTIGMWEVLLRLGWVSVSETRFYQLKTLRPIEGDMLSSGQWSWLGTFGSLGAEIRDGSLILVDEPENSLHPRWQQEYIKELHHVVSGFSGCQVVVATHSPLIASGVSKEWGCIRTLTRPRRAGAFVRSKRIETAYGWSASDVYDGHFGLESTRAIEFLAVANHALRAVSGGGEIAESERLRWISEINCLWVSLPMHDPMRDVLQSIAARLKVPGVSSVVAPEVVRG